MVSGLSQDWEDMKTLKEVYSGGCFHDWEVLQRGGGYRLWISLHFHLVMRFFTTHQRPNVCRRIAVITIFETDCSFPSKRHSTDNKIKKFKPFWHSVLVNSINTYLITGVVINYFAVIHRPNNQFSITIVEFITWATGSDTIACVHGVPSAAYTFPGALSKI